MSHTHQSLIDMFDALPEVEQTRLLDDLKHRVQMKRKTSVLEFLPSEKGTVNSDAQNRVREMRSKWGNSRLNRLSLVLNGHS